MKISPARKAAFDILLKIEVDRAFSSVLLPIYEEKLGEKDAALCHQLTLGVLRKKIYLDWWISKFTQKSVGKFDNEVIISLRLGIYQMIFLEKIPAYSAINESVNLVKASKKRSAAGLVNAILRRVSNKKLKTELQNKMENISIETSHPNWLIDRWINQFGVEKTKKLAAANNELPKLIFRFTRKFYTSTAENRREILEKAIKGASKSQAVEDCFTVNNSNKLLKNLAERGLIYFQDEGSQIGASVVNLKEGENFLDVCASPGSKTTWIGRKYRIEKIEKRKSFFIAGDFYEHRISILKRNCINQGLKFINLVRYDAESTLPFAESSFDAVLVDAPCSGTGTIRHNPEIRYFLREENFAELSGKQFTILENASKLVKIGGRLVYSTCSLEIDENEEVLQRFMANEKNFKVIIPKTQKKLITPEGYARTFPHCNHIGGFFMGILQRTG